MPNDCIALITTVPYLVYFVIFFLPASPSFASFPIAGITTVNNWKIMEALIYGIMPRAKIVSLDKAPPENISKKPMSAPPFSARNLLSASPFIPGVGT
jgi:hypothetical protein